MTEENKKLENSVPEEFREFSVLIFFSIFSSLLHFIYLFFKTFQQLYLHFFFILKSLILTCFTVKPNQPAEAVM